MCMESWFGLQMKHLTLSCHIKQAMLFTVGSWFANFVHVP